MSEVKKALIKLRKLLRYKAHWTQGVYARTEKGNECSPTGRHGVCFCLVGGLQHVMGVRDNVNDFDANYIAARKKIEMMVRGRGGMTIIGWNDMPGRTIKEIHEVLDDAIAAS